MQVYYALRGVAYRIAALRGIVLSLRSFVDGVYLLDKYLSPFLLSLSNTLSDGYRDIEDVAGYWLEFYNDFQSGQGGSSLLQSLLYWADTLIGIARDPYWFVRTAIYNSFRSLYDFWQNPPGYIQNVLINSLRVSYDILFRPGVFVANAVNAAMGDLISLRNDPRSWIVDRLASVVPDLRQLLNNPREFVRYQVELLFPELVRFIRDPDGYIVEKVINGLERFLSSYKDRLMKIAENILNIVF
jgi:hypothetical protein